MTWNHLLVWVGLGWRNHPLAAAPAAAVASLVSDSVQPHRRQPTRLPLPWDSPGKNTGVGCHFLVQCMKVKSESEVAQSRQILPDPMDCSPPGSSVHGIFQARVLEWGAIAFSDPLATCLKLKLKSSSSLGMKTVNWLSLLNGSYAHLMTGKGVLINSSIRLCTVG